MDIYIKPNKRARVTGVNKITIKDVAEVIAPPDVAKKINKMKLVDIKTTEKKYSYLVSIMDIIKAINNVFPEHTVNNVGEQDTVVQYVAEKKPDNPFWKWLKIAFVSLVLMAGSSTAIMSFQTDSQIPKVFENYYRIFYGEQNSNPLIINIPYAIGLAVGIIVFFNHFMGKKMTNDPTPIEVEMSVYETDVNDTVLGMLQSSKGDESNGNN